MTERAGGSPRERDPVRDRTLTDHEVLAMIRAKHLRANIGGYEAGQENAVIHWDRARIDPGFGGGSGPYAKVPITSPEWPPDEEIVVRVYPPERLRKRLAKLWARTP